MSKRIDTVKGLFGQLIHYEDGRYAGESWPGLFEGSYEHYDADGGYAGYSDPGVIADLVHHDEHGAYVGETHDGLFGQKHHYGTRGYAGTTSDGLFGAHTSMLDDGPDEGDAFGFDEDFGSDGGFDAGDW